MATSVRPLAPGRVDVATELCVRAFGDYPLLAALFPGSPARRAPISRAFYGATVRDCLAHGRVDTVDDDGQLRAVAAWLAPGAYPLGPARAARFAPVVGHVLRRFPHRAPRGVQALARLEHHHPTEPPHWYLAAIAVEPAHQGQGLGRRAIEPGLRRADDNGEEAFLETARRGSAAWYHRLGFDVEVEAPCFRGGPPQWFMRRRAVTSRS